MKTSLVSSPASASTSAAIRADRPQQLKSIAVYWRGRKMVLMQRPQRRLSLLLCGLLRRSMRSLFGSLPAKLNMGGTAKRVLSAGALCALALASATTAHATATVDTLPVNTLPDGYTVKYGQVGIGTNGNQMNVNIGTDKAIINWNSFSIGSQAGVDFHFNNATTSSSVLNRVTGNDPSKIMGSLTSNGKVFLINSAGILVGKTARIDVAGFVASTLNISDSNFLAGRMMFEGQPGSAAGVMIEEDGSIKTSEGGSVYLIGANVENRGIITSPGGEVLLAAGESVELVDTGTPGVKIVVKGDKGKVKNLGKIIAKAGTIGFGAALIENDGVINASSVDKIGGRIFLRASKDLTTTATSAINADGTEGGHVVLYADDSANIDGDVSALGNVDGKGGKGGYVDTSGKHRLAVKYVPRLSAGGEWYIDPYNVDIVADNAQEVDNGVNLSGGVITATANSSVIHVGTINTQLNNNISVSISTGNASSPGDQFGDITLQNGAHIVKDSGFGATLTLDAARNITIASGASITDNTEGTLGLTLNAGGAIAHDGAITLTGGAFAATGASFSSNGTTALTSGSMTVHTTGNQVLGTVTGTADLNFTTDGGAISQRAGTTLAGTTLTAAAVHGITLNNAGNSILNSFMATNSGSGIIGFANSASTNILSLGALTNSGGGITIETGGELTTTGAINASGDIKMTSTGALYAEHAMTGQNIELKSIHTGGDDRIMVSGDLVATGTGGSNGTVTLNSAGEISQGEGGSIIARTVAATAASSINLTGYSNQFQHFTGASLNNYNVDVSTMGNLTIDAGGVTGGNISLTTRMPEVVTFDAQEPPTADLVINGQLNATQGEGSRVTLSSEGSITQDTGAGAGIMAESLDATAMKGIALNSSGNRVNKFTARNGGNPGVATENGPNWSLDESAQGNIALTNTAATLTLNDTVQNRAAGGNVTIINTGNILGTPIHDQQGHVLNGTFADGKVTMTAKALDGVGGNVTLGQIVTRDLDVNADGKITQQGGNAVVLAVSGTMRAVANTGILLNGNSNFTIRNHIVNFSATNNVSGDITLVNQGNGETNNTLGAVKNNGGNIAIENYGGLETGSEKISATGSVTIATHSPLTIGSGGIGAGSGVTLSAGDGSSISDAMILNGAVQTTLGNLAFNANSVAANAPIYGPIAPIFTSTTPVIFGSNYTYALSPPIIQPSTPITPIVVNNTTLDQNVASTANNVDNGLGDAGLLPDNNPKSNPGGGGGQTIGGGADEFGGSGDDEKQSDGKKSLNTKLPICS